MVFDCNKNVCVCIFYQKIGSNGADNLIDTMYSNRENLEAIFRMMDLDSNGLISIDEFKQACEMLSGKQYLSY